MIHKLSTKKRRYVHKQNSRRYSAVQLREFRDAILGFREAALNDVTSIRDTYSTPMTGDDNGANEPEVGFVERSHRGSSLAENAQLIERQLQLIARLDAALKRIENRTYGNCRDCGKLIDRIRLLAVPHSQECLTCKNAKTGSSAGVQRIFLNRIL